MPSRIPLLHDALDDPGDRSPIGCGEQSAHQQLGGRVERVDVRGDNFTDDGNRFSAGVALKHEVGIFTVSSTLGAGYYRYDKARAYSLGGDRFRATADLDGKFVSGEARVSAFLPQGNFYVKPSVAVSMTRLWQNGYSESGSGPLNWQVDGTAHTALALHTSVEVGYAFDLAERPARAYARVGATSRLNGRDVGVVSQACRRRCCAGGPFCGVIDGPPSPGADGRRRYGSGAQCVAVPARADRAFQQRHQLWWLCPSARALLSVLR